MLWGTVWIPSRVLAELGTWATPVAYSLPFIVLSPIVLRRFSTLRGYGGVYWLTGVLMAVSLATFTEAFVHGEVASVIVIFYSAPVWATIFERWLLGEQITAKRVLAIALGLAGVMTIFGFGTRLPLPSTMSDWLALVSSLTWTLALTLIRRNPEVASLDRVLVVTPFLGVAALCVALVSGAGPLIWPSAPEAAALSWLALFGLLWVLLIVAGTVYAAAWISPGRVAILMMFEVIVGLGSAALYAGEVIGVRELVGASLVLLAGLAELVRLTPSEEPIG